LRPALLAFATRVALANCAMTALFVVAVVRPVGAEEVRESHYVMGTLLEVTLDARDRTRGQSLIREAVAIARQLDSELSSWNANSDLWQLNLAAGRGLQTVPQGLYDVLALSSDLASATNGAFDITVGVAMEPPVQIPGLELPSDTEMRRDCIDHTQVHLVAPDTAELARACTVINLGGVGKGFAAARMADQLKSANVNNAIVNFGQSSIAVVGPPIQTPTNGFALRRAGELIGTVFLRDLALSTSESLHGDVSNDTDAARTPHIIDPRNAELVRASRLAIVVADDAGVAEGWSTALVVAPDEVLALAQASAGIEAMVFDGDRQLLTDGFEKRSGWKAAPP
jgi:thiamine biosynthesis lipoprotein